ncbi:MAG: hypothetical protein KF688_11860 [Pirellulales bacterium]|nr:hypothetical protein [Pirellulales bacterium]
MRGIPSAKLLPLLYGALLAASCAGCSPERETLHDVRGQVLVDGRPLTHGVVRFVPRSGRPVSSEIAADGSFRLLSRSVGVDADGVPAGRYRVAVNACEILDEDAGEIAWHAPQRYADFRNSGIDVAIDGSQRDLTIELTWNDGDDLAADVPDGNAIKSSEGERAASKGKEAERGK